MPLYARPTVLDEALQVLARGATILAGGTDHYAARVGKPLSEPILDITAIRGLRAGPVCRSGVGRWLDYQLR